MMIDSIVESEQIIGKVSFKDVKITLKVPEMIMLDKMSLKQLRNLTISQVEWYFSYSLGFILSDGQSCKAGTS